MCKGGIGCRKAAVGDMEIITYAIEAFVTNMWLRSSVQNNEQNSLRPNRLRANSPVLLWNMLDFETEERRIPDEMGAC